MYRFFLFFLIIAACVAGLFFGWPWYTPAVAGFLFAGLLPVWRRGGFWFAYLGAFLVWGVYTGYLHFDSEGRLSDRLAVTFGLASGWLLVLLTGFVGGLTAGLGALFGVSLRRVFVNKAGRSELAEE